MSSPEVTPITLQLLKNITENFSEERKVGSGGYGEVYKGVLNGDEIAVKKLFIVNGLDDKAFKNELSNLMNAKHVNIIRLIHYCYEITHQHIKSEGHPVLVRVIERALCFEYMQGGSLAKHISDESCIYDWPTTYKIIKGTCEGLHYLHKGRGEANYIYHLDLKPENILLDKNMVPKIGDFGLSTLFRTSNTHQTSTTKGTTGFMPPEYINMNVVTPKNDVFSLGVIIFYIIAGQKGYYDYCESRSLRLELIERVQEYWKKKTHASAGCTWHKAYHLGVERCTEIAMSCVEIDRAKRPTTTEIVYHLNKLDAQIEEMSKKDPKWLVGQRLGTAMNAGRGPLYVVIVYAFDCTTTSTPAWHKMDRVYWLVHEKLTHLVNTYLGYIHVMSTPNKYTFEMKLVDSAETESTGYSVSSRWKQIACTKKMASGLYGAHELIGNSNGVILLFSDGLINKGDFFNGTEEFVSKVPVHTFTVGSDAYNHVLHAIAQHSPGGTFNPDPVPKKAKLLTPFSQLLDTILSSTIKYYEKRPGVNSGTRRRPLGVFIVYAFDCTTSSPAWDKTNDVYWLVNEKLTHRVDRIGFVYSMSTPNTYRSDMKFVDSAEAAGNYKGSLNYRDATTCDKNMASGLYEADRLTRDHANQNSIVLLFSDGLINNGDFFDGAEEFVSKVPVHTFTLYGDAYNHGLRAIAANSPGGTFNSVPVPDKPKLSASFSHLLDCIINGSM